MNDSRRIEYIDAMRGFTMLLVVAHHVAAFCLGIGDYVPSIHPVLCEFRMPLFFFISGFVLYKEEAIWNASYATKFLLVKKFPAQIITTSIFFFVFLIINAPRPKSVVSFTPPGTSNSASDPSVSAITLIALFL